MHRDNRSNMIHTKQPHPMRQLPMELKKVQQKHLLTELLRYRLHILIKSLLQQKLPPPSPNSFSPS
jgi:hypothetical protein